MDFDTCILIGKRHVSDHWSKVVESVTYLIKQLMQNAKMEVDMSDLLSVLEISLT